MMVARRRKLLFTLFGWMADWFGWVGAGGRRFGEGRLRGLVVGGGRDWCGGRWGLCQRFFGMDAYIVCMHGNRRGELDERL